MKILAIITMPDSYAEQIARQVDLCEWIKSRIKSDIGVSNTTVEVSLEKPKGKKKTNDLVHLQYCSRYSIMLPVMMY